jgi:uncharacterized protein
LSEDGRDPFWGWSDLAIVATLGFCAFLLGYLLAAGAIWLIPAKLPRGASILIPQFVGYGAALLPLIALFRWKYDRPVAASLDLGVPPQQWVRAVLSGLGLSIIVLGLGAILRTPQIDSPIQHLMDDPRSAPFLIFFAVTLGPVMEELIFRGLLQPLLVRSVGVILGIVLAAAPFALLHGPEYAWSWKHVLLICVAGIGFGWKRWSTGSTGSAALMHAAYNGVLVCGYLLGRKLL